MAVKSSHRPISSSPVKMTVTSDDEMDARCLATITAEAVSNVLFFKTKTLFPPTTILASGVEHAVNRVFHLRVGAEDIDVAHLEIACDAALAYANEWNQLHPSDAIPPRWMYTCVRSLLTHILKPALIAALDADEPVQRLLEWVDDQKHQHQHPQPRPYRQENSATPSEPGTLTFTADKDVDEDGNDSDIIDASLTELSSAGVPPNEPRGVPKKKVLLRAKKTTVTAPLPPVVEAKTPWTNEDITTMIELRAQGLTHAETCQRLGRGKGAVENKYGRVVKDTAWMPLVAESAARFLAAKKARRARTRAAAAVPLSTTITAARNDKRKRPATVAAVGSEQRFAKDPDEMGEDGDGDEDEDEEARSLVKRRCVLSVAEAAGLE